MFDKVSKILVKVFGSRNERLIKAYSIIAQQVGEFEEQVKQLDGEQLRAKTEEFKAALKDGSQPEDILPEAFAVVREAARRNVDMRHFDVQLVGGNVLYENKIAEMATGEGKTLVATLAVYLVYLTERKVHIVTVNDYLAKRDAEWMTPVYEALGLTVGAIQADMDTMGDDRRAQYDCDVTYGTNNEFGFDYLRDNMKVSLDQMVQGPLQYAIIDEVDSILIDEARTPLIISGPAQYKDELKWYRKADDVVQKLIYLQKPYDRFKQRIDSGERRLASIQGELSEAKKDKDSKRIGEARKAIEQSERELKTARAELAGATQYYEVEQDKKSAALTEEGSSMSLEKLSVAEVDSFVIMSTDDTYKQSLRRRYLHLIEQALRAHVTFEKERDYVVMDGKVIIVDEFTGRLMHGRQWSDGLHQAVEAKENVAVKEETQTLGTVTLQNFFKMYDQISGMTGTAATEAEEFKKIYELEVVVIPTNEPCIRDDQDDVIYKSMKEKYDAVVEEIYGISNSGRPVLVGTASVEKNEKLKKKLEERYGKEYKFEVLNAREHAREGKIVQKAGKQHEENRQMRGNVTIATNMAGRGTDIKLGDGVAEIGGLHVLGTERHEARRIDNQLRGRCGRQGDAGSSQFFLSFDDDLMRIFAPEWTVKALSWIGWEEGQPIAHKRISKGIEKAQKKVEERNFEIRKSLLEYDEVMDYQRKFFYSRRRKILSGEGIGEIIKDMIEKTIVINCKKYLDENYPLGCIIEWAKRNKTIRTNQDKFRADLEQGVSGLRRVGQIQRIIEDQSKDVTLKMKDIEAIVKAQAKEDAENSILVSVGEYLDDYEGTPNLKGLRSWASRVFQVSLSVTKMKEETDPEEIAKELISAAAERIDKTDCSELGEFLKEDFVVRALTEWANEKFGLTLVEEFKGLNTEQVNSRLIKEVQEKYKKREITYAVEFMIDMVYGSQERGAYAFKILADWVNKRYKVELSPEVLQTYEKDKLLEKLKGLNNSYYETGLLEEVSSHVKEKTEKQLVKWAKERFGSELKEDELCSTVKAKEKLVAVGKEFLRKELTELERGGLLKYYDDAWKGHLYEMDHLKDSIWMRSMAEKDPKTEYKLEGHRMFQEMLELIRERIAEQAFKMEDDPQILHGSVYNISQTMHDEVGQFAMSEQQRAAAQAPQGEQKVKQIRLEGPKVGRNDPCPCKSGKKYKKCCGKNV